MVLSLRGMEGEATTVVSPSGGCLDRLWRLGQTTPGRFAPPPFLSGSTFIDRVATNMSTHLLRAIACILLLAAVALAQDYERAVRALRPADVKPQEAALLDSLEREART